MNKKLKYILLFALAPFFIISCDNILDDADGFIVTTEKKIYKVGETVTFNVEGNPNYITFYSGEPGKEYKNITRTEINADDIERVELSFSVFAQWGKGEPNQPKYPLQVFLGENFSGLVKDSEEADKERIIEFERTAINKTEEVSMPATANQKGDINIDISEYAKDFTLAFKFEGYEDTAAQRTITISKLNLKSYLKNGVEVTVAQAMDMNFIAYDMLTLPVEAKDNRYYVGAVNGSWNFNNIGANEIKIAGGPKNALTNEDWLISTPMALNLTSPDKGMAIKDITTGMDGYIYVYDKPGRYEVTFVAGNANYKGQKRVIRTIEVEIEVE